MANALAETSPTGSKKNKKLKNRTIMNSKYRQTNKITNFFKKTEPQNDILWHKNFNIEQDIQNQEPRLTNTIYEKNQKNNKTNQKHNLFDTPNSTVYNDSLQQKNADLKEFGNINIFTKEVENYVVDADGYIKELEEYDKDNKELFKKVEHRNKKVTQKKLTFYNSRIIDESLNIINPKTQTSYRWKNFEIDLSNSFAILKDELPIATNTQERIGKEIYNSTNVPISPCQEIHEAYYTSPRKYYKKEVEKIEGCNNKKNNKFTYHWM